MLRTDRGRLLVASMPRDRVLTESDGPFAQIDGRPATPFDTPAAEEALSLLWNIDAVQVNAHMRDNLRRLVTA